MRLLIVWVFIFSPASSQAVTGPHEVNGTLGGSLSVQCQYEETYKNNNKYWCRGPDSSCSIVVQTSHPVLKGRKQNVSIMDDPSAHTFTVIIEGLRAEDAGSYQCGIERIILSDPLFPVTVTVLTATTPSPGHDSTTDSKPSSPPVDDKQLSEANLPVTAANSGSSENKPTVITSHLEESLPYLIPAVVLLLLLFLLAAVLLFRAHKKKHQATSENNKNLHSPHTDPDSMESISYAVIKRLDVSRQPGACNTEHASNSAMSEVCYASINDPTQESPETTGISYATIQLQALDRQEEVYANMEPTQGKPFLEYEYSEVNV